MSLVGRSKEFYYSLIEVAHGKQDNLIHLIFPYSINATLYNQMNT